MRSFEVVKNKNKFFLLSAVIIALGIIFYFINGLQLDVEYRGGTRILIETNSEVDTNKADAVVEEVLGKSVTTQSLKTYNPEDEDKMIYMLRFDIASEETLTDEERTLVYDTVAGNFDVKENGNHDMLSVSPTIGQETLLNGLKACFIASVLIVLYVTWRF
ncbi:MAG TPA: protein translocase subunit SecF, partial [Clostridia bacterium]